jgi:hypothetical protein
MLTNLPRQATSFVEVRKMASADDCALSATVKDCENESTHRQFIG